MNRVVLLALSLLFPLLGSTANAQLVPQIINYQGRVVVGTTNFNGTGSFKFALVNSNGSITYWSNDGTSSAGSQPTNAVSLIVAKGLYSVVLGDIGYSNMTVIPASVFSNFDVRLRVWFNDGANGSQLLSPDQRIASVGYAMTAANVPDGAITGAKIAAGAVTGTTIAPGTISSTNIAPSSLDFSRLNVPAAPASGQVLSFNGTSLAWTPAAGGIWSLNGTNAYYNTGNVGINTDSPQARLDVNGSMHVGSYFPDGSPKLIRFGDINGVNGYVSIGENNADDQMELTAGRFVFNIGRVGIGTSTPRHGLTIANTSATPGWTSNNWAGAVALDSAGAIAWAPDSSAWGFGMGHSNGAFLMFRTAANPGTMSDPAVYDFAIDDFGNIGMGTISPVGRLHLYDGFAASERIESGGATNSWSRIEYKNGNGQWDVGTSRSYFGDAFYFARDPSPPVFAIYPNGDTYVQGTMACAALTIRGGADLAEPFQMEDKAVEKGSVVVIDEANPGRLKQSTHAYDRRVAGIVSGAHGIKPGIALHQEGALEGGQDVALSGRVYVAADTSSGPIEPGDLLTTSDIPGHAMKVSDYPRAQGAVIGKAMSSLSEGQGEVLVLVTLQ
ncbi:MAG: hypothetical protein ACR2HH_14185 [Chthoniobacterales bacterium]